MRTSHARIASTARNGRRWRRMRGRLGLVALWAALSVWVAGASVVLPDPDPAVLAAAPVHEADIAPHEHADPAVEPAVTESIDTEGALRELTPEEEASLYIAGR